MSSIRKIRVKYLGSCPNCGSKKLSVFGEITTEDYLPVGCMVMCDKCGRTGSSDATEDEGDAYVVWDPTKTNHKKDMRRLLRQVSGYHIPTAIAAVTHAYNQCGNSYAGELHTAIQILNLIHNFKEKNNGG